jgi:DNA-binding CsgD family transcriptional regulator
LPFSPTSRAGHDVAMADTQRERLRPIERRVLALKEAGVSDTEIARRFRRGRRFIEQVESLARMDGRHADRRTRRPGALRPVERRILAWRDRGMSVEQLAERFRRSPEYVARVEKLARYKLRNAARG